jgi:hypothetical protein
MNDVRHLIGSPSRCDRILWKSTVKPAPNTEEAELALHPKSRTLVGQLVALALRPLSARGRAASDEPVLTDIQRTSPSSEMIRRSSTVAETNLRTAVPPPDVVTPTRSDTLTLQHSHSNEDMREKKLQFVQPSVRDINRSRRATLGVYLPSLSANPPEPSAADIVPSTIMRSAGLPIHSSNTRYTSLPAPFRWRFLPFLSRDSANVVSSEPDSLPEPTPQPRRGDVVCLSYDTLDDRAMRRLEGLSDHRPEIGSYAENI